MLDPRHTPVRASSAGGAVSILEAQANDTSAPENPTVVTEDGSSDLRGQLVAAPPAASTRRTRVIRRPRGDMVAADGGSRDQDPIDVAGHWQDAATAQMAHVGVHHRRSSQD
jgi:hypothetical protein